jgi:hypothetical protein
MTVAELKEFLEDLDPDMDVIVDGTKLKFVTVDKDEEGREFVELE